ncbi:Zn(2)-C6 fungal-type domain-containing protein [Fusarium falciforme]|uniref:Zn(2)-C6 fungal-type domain-containing protein n=1 Tax=Fusarium falciforme TaxID=195108 RepID=UPI0023009ED2|nr:Zn(2)-C6 fungal-type domain-containing protein [Fusarium falciforme]WAO86068.1 Zn(2)-C6 fungal-type domain-containing protein [Fusarium falciforme]
METRNGEGPLELPPQHEVVSAAQKYIAGFNSAIPLFNPDRLLYVIRRWYESSDRRDYTTWAAINTMLALVHRQTPPEEATPSKNTAKYTNNAQSVLTNVVMEETTLLSVQVLVGMTLLFQGVQDLKPATMLIAMALRLVHQLGLHTRKGSEHLDSNLTLERYRVFWIAYILDRDISMRTKQPPIQREMDIDLEWPSADPQDGAGVFIAADGTSSFNFFLSRVQLAQIQGEIYDAMYSTGSRALSNQEKLERAAGLRYRLDDWFYRVPQQFRSEAILSVGEVNSSRYFGVLFATHLFCRISMCQVHVMETRWLQTLQDFGRDAVRGDAVSPTPSPVGWHEVVNECREYMKLFAGIEQKDPAFIWMTACTYISAGVCLIANNMFNPYHENMEYDERLANISFSFLDDMAQQVPLDGLKRAQESCQMLQHQAYAVRLRISNQDSCH